VLVLICTNFFLLFKGFAFQSQQQFQLLLSTSVQHFCSKHISTSPVVKPIPSTVFFCVCVCVCDIQNSAFCRTFRWRCTPMPRSQWRSTESWSQLSSFANSDIALALRPGRGPLQAPGWLRTQQGTKVSSFHSYES